jgi:hypothetical protein
MKKNIFIKNYLQSDSHRITPYHRFEFLPLISLNIE